jgi:PKD repeat protein
LALTYVRIFRRYLKMHMRTSILFLCVVFAADALFSGCSSGSNTPEPSPAADFTADPQSGDAPLSVQFSDASTDGVTSWEWDFDGDTVVDSTAQNPTHTYSDAGTYSVSLKVTGAGGSDTEAKADYITVTAPVPSAIKVREWDFDGDDLIDSTEQNPTHTYSHAGTYSVSLKVTGAGGSDTEAKADYITVTAPVPSAIKVTVGDKGHRGTASPFY